LGALGCNVELSSFDKVWDAVEGKVKKRLMHWQGAMVVWIARSRNGLCTGRGRMMVWRARSRNGLFSDRGCGWQGQETAYPLSGTHCGVDGKAKKWLML
jgi:hypothetical protein